MITKIEFQRVIEDVAKINSVNIQDITGLESMFIMLRDFKFETVLDVGAGHGFHSKLLKKFGKNPTALDYKRKTSLGSSQITQDIDFEFIETDFLKFNSKHQYDAIWCSHVLEHQENVGMFLRNLCNLVRTDGVICITVPPLKNEIVGGHLSLWNAGLLLYNLIVAGIDCSEARVGIYGYNISVVVVNKSAKLPNLNYDNGDIESLARFFPCCVNQGFDGRIKNIGW